MTRAVAIAALVLAFAVPAGATDPAEVKAEVPALFALHDVIYPLWHTAWPAKDVAMLQELLPQLEAGVQAVAAAELPGILRDKQAKWAEGVAALQADVARYRAAAASGAAEELLAVAEQVHAHYEGLVRTVRPVMKELDAYHQVLYQVYHYLAPEARLAELDAKASELVAHCQALVTAPVPKRFAAREEGLRPAFAELCTATDALAALPADADAAAVAAAVEKVHTLYQKAEHLFE